MLRLHFVKLLLPDNLSVQVETIQPVRTEKGEDVFSISHCGIGR